MSSAVKGANLREFATGKEGSLKTAAKLEPSKHHFHIFCTSSSKWLQGLQYVWHFFYASSLEDSDNPRFSRCGRIATLRSTRVCMYDERKGSVTWHGRKKSAIQTDFVEVFVFVDSNNASAIIKVTVEEVMAGWLATIGPSIRGP